MATTTRELKKEVQYFNGSCNTVVKLNIKKGTFKFGKTVIHPNSSPDEIKEMYSQAASFAVQQLGK